MSKTLNKGERIRRRRNNLEDDVTKCSELNNDETRCERFVRVFLFCAKRFITFLFSHVGLTCVVVAYTIVGGFMFKAIELEEEKLTRQSVGQTTDAYTDRIVTFYENADPDKLLDKRYWDEEMNKILREYEVEIHSYTRERDWAGRYEGDQYQWSFAEAMLYSVTVITTIGYGHITPKTVGGRVLTIVYGSLGIPLTMLCLGNIGNLMAGLFRIIYRYACVNMTYYYIKFQRRRLKERFVKRVKRRANNMKEWAMRNHSIVSAALHLSSEESVHDHNTRVRWLSRYHSVPSGEASKCDQRRRHSDSVIHAMKATKKTKSERKRSLSSVTQHHGELFKDKQPATHELTAIPEEMAVELQERMNAETDFIDDDVISSNEDDITTEAIIRSSDNSTATSSLSLGDFEHDEIMLKTRLKTTRDMVPISVCLLLVSGYIIAGAILFTSWEDTWTFPIGVYFCFITLTTIGFGDFVPGMSRLDDDERSVYCAIYLLFGMALLAMSFHLIQEEVKHKVRKLAKRIGLIEDKLTKILDKDDDSDD